MFCCCDEGVVRVADVELPRNGWRYHPSTPINNAGGYPGAWPPPYTDLRYRRFRIRQRVTVNGVVRGFDQEYTVEGTDILNTVPATNRVCGDIRLSAGIAQEGAVLSVDGSVWRDSLQAGPAVVGPYGYTSTRGALGLPRLTYEDLGFDPSDPDLPGPITDEFPGWQNFPVGVSVFSNPFGPVWNSPTLQTLSWSERYIDEYFGNQVYIRAAQGSTTYELLDPETWPEWRARFDAFAGPAWVALEQDDLWPTTSGLYHLRLRQTRVTGTDPFGFRSASYVPTFALYRVTGFHLNLCGAQVEPLVLRAPATAQNGRSWDWRRECRVRLPLVGEQTLRAFDSNVGGDNRLAAEDVTINPVGVYPLQFPATLLDASWANDGVSDRAFMLATEPAALKLPLNALGNPCNVEANNEIMTGIDFMGVPNGLPGALPSHQFYFVITRWTRVPTDVFDSPGTTTTQLINEHGRLEWNKIAIPCSTCGIV